MGFTKPDLPQVDPDTFLRKPLMERMQAFWPPNWVEHGFGSPRMVHTIYIAKLVFFYALGGVLVATLTSGLPAFWHVSAWWNQPIVYEKVILWTVLLETIGVAGSWGPLAGKFKPMTGGILFWARPGTIRLRPWQRVPFTTRRPAHLVDVALYVGAARQRGGPAALPRSAQRLAVNSHARTTRPALVNPALLIAPIAAARAHRAARQDDIPRRARRAVPARPVLLHAFCRSST